MAHVCHIPRGVLRWLLACLFSWVVTAGLVEANEADRDQPIRYECAFGIDWPGELQDAIEKGEIADPAARVRPRVASRPRRAPAGEAACFSEAHIFPFEDSESLLLTDFSTPEFLDLAAEAINDLLATYGDHFDFIGMFTAFEPAHLIGTAVNFGIENTVTGIGIHPVFSSETYNRRADLGIGGENVEGIVVMWDISNWKAGTEPEADFTRLVIAHEFEHRFATFLPPLLDGKLLQGNNLGCGETSHWNHKVDGQGGALGISEWVGQFPATRPNRNFYSFEFNTDTGGTYSLVDLYLMGYVSADELDDMISQLRYMDTSDCISPYNGHISLFRSSHIIAAAGPRIPDASSAQKHFRTGWIMLHLPSEPPTPEQLTLAAGIIEQHRADWAVSTIGRGTMDITLFEDCNCNDLPDDEEIAGGVTPDIDGNGVPDDCQDCVDAMDQDGDGIGDACDNCAELFNPEQGPVPFGQTLRFTDPAQIVWDVPATVHFIRGDLAEVSTYGFDLSSVRGPVNAIRVSDVPAPGAGFYYLVAVAGDCDARTWQTSPGVEPQRDSALP